jgi:hypothetical protein
LRRQNDDRSQGRKRLLATHESDLDDSQRNRVGAKLQIPADTRNPVKTVGGLGIYWTNCT